MIKHLLVATAILAGAASAQAEVQNIGAYGYWASFAGVGSGGKKLCGIRTSWHDNTGSFMVKTEGDTVFFDIWKLNWHIPTGTQIELLFQVDNSPVFRLHGVGNQQRNGSDIQVDFKPDDTNTVNGESSILTMVNLLRNGRILKIAFPDGSEPEWDGNLEGSGAALDDLVTCLGYLLRGNQSTQPYSTQPFSPGKIPSGTQPFQRGSGEVHG